jgi:hypothetical protein
MTMRALGAAATRAAISARSASSRSRLSLRISSTISNGWVTARHRQHRASCRIGDLIFAQRVEILLVDRAARW